MQPAFNIFNELSAWGKTLQSWQHLLLSKLVATEELPDETLDEIFAEYLIDQHLAGPDAVRVAWDMALPQFQEGAPTVVSTLTAVTSVSGVNALTAGETLSFGPKLTVVYGPTRRTPAADRFAIQDSTSEVAALLATLTAQTNLVRLKELAAFGDAEAGRLLSIEKQLRSAITDC